MPSPATGPPPAAGARPWGRRSACSASWRPGVAKTGSPGGRAGASGVVPMSAASAAAGSRARRVREVVPKRCARFRRSASAADGVEGVHEAATSRPAGGRQGRCDWLRWTHAGAKTNRGYRALKRRRSENGGAGVDTHTMGHGVVTTASAMAKSRSRRDVCNGVALTTLVWYPWPCHKARRGLRAYRAGLARLAEQTPPPGPQTLADVCGCRPSPTAAAATQDHAPHRGEAGTAQGCAQRGGACWVRHGQQLVAPEEPDEDNLHVRICGEGAGNRCLYPEPDRLQRPLLRRSRFR